MTRLSYCLFLYFLLEHRLDRLLHQRGVAAHRHDRRPNEPHHGGDRTGQKRQWDRHDHEPGVQLRRVEPSERQHQVIAAQSADSKHPAGYKENHKHQKKVCHESIHAQNGHDRDVVGRIVAQVVGNAALGLAKVGRLGNPAKIKEFLRRAKLQKRGQNVADVATKPFDAQTVSEQTELG